MNILGYVSFILLMIGIVFQMYFSNWFFDEKIQQNFKGFYQNYSVLQKEYVEKRFEKIPKKSFPKNPKLLSSPQKQEHIFHKSEETPYCMRLNLYPLLKATEYKKHFLYSIFFKLILDLYSDTLLTDKEALVFVDEFLKIMQKEIQQEKDISLAQIKFQQPSLQKKYYLMLKNTPSLLHYIKIKKGEKTCLACADFTLLKAIFNKEIAEKLLYKLNPLQRIPIIKQDLTHLCSIYRLETIDFSYFATKHTKNLEKEMTISVYDTKTGIRTNQTFSSSFNEKE